MPRERLYWYLTTVYFCPVCCSEERCRKRMYTPKPSDPALRQRWHDTYDWCEN